MTRWGPSTLSIYCPGQESPRPQGRQRLLRPRPARPALYQPIACPRQVATNAPTIPRMVSEDKARKLVRAGVKKFCDNTSNEADDNGPKDAHTNLRALRPVLQPRGDKWLRPPIERPRPDTRLATDFCVAREVIFCQAGPSRIVSVARIRQDPRKSARSFKRLIFPDISEFESHMPSHAVGSVGCAPCLPTSITRRRKTVTSRWQRPRRRTCCITRSRWRSRGRSPRRAWTSRRSSV
jgi:hypothetical protein